MADSDGPGGMIIVTHMRPHLDEVVAIWLLRTFDPRCRQTEYRFIPYFGQPPSGDNVLTLGIGGGKFDEHQLRHLTSATRLVYDDLLRRGLIPNDAHEDRALEWLVAYADGEDQGRDYGKRDELRPFLLPNIIQAHRDRTGRDEDAVQIGLELIEDVMIDLNTRAAFLRDWERRVEFETPWGKGVGLESDYGHADTFAYGAGFTVRVQRHRQRQTASIKCEPTSQADLTEAYRRATVLEPTSWYLHQSKHMLISNIDPATGRTPTALSLTQLIDLVKT